ncbi:MAG: hypothetical protein NUV65_06190 [Candidatus Roizmanbacteria bacterium]|nr:hypothetical protein [Candidatus Roizmanbacteria bacterium]
MARVRITEYSAKKTLAKNGIMPCWKGMKATVNTNVHDIVSFFGDLPLVVKVDEGIKKRGKQGLVFINGTADDIVSFIEKIQKRGYSQFLIEPFIKHEVKDERYLSLERVRGGMKILYGEEGGIDVENVWDRVKTYVVSEEKPLSKFSVPSGLIGLIEKLIAYMNMYHISFFEINPLVISSSIQILDCAMEVDDAASGSQGMEDVMSGVVHEKTRHKVEETISALDENTPASLKFTLLNKDGSIWVLLSGGGASLVLADEVADMKKGNLLANYGEYSGSPTSEDTYLYTKAVLSALCESKAPKKVLLIAGGVANFTDVSKTFKGIIQALKEVSDELKKQNVRVFVRRGGPNQTKGLAEMKEFLIQKGLLGSVDGPEMPLTDVVHKAIDLH